MSNTPLRSRSSSGFTMIELMVVLGLVSLAAVYGSQMLVSIGRGVKGNQEAADFVQAQGTGYYALSTNPHQFCVDSKIIGLKFPTRDEVSAYIQSQADPGRAAIVPPDLLNTECTKYPYGVPGAQVSFVPKADRLLGVLPVESLLKASEDPKARKDERGREVSSNNLSEQQQGQKVACQRFTPKNYMYHDPDYSGPVPQPPKIISVPFTLGINRTTGGPIGREMSVSLKVDQDGVIADCTPLGQSGGGNSAWISVVPAPVNSSTLHWKLNGINSGPTTWTNGFHQDSIGNTAGAFLKNPNQLCIDSGYSGFAGGCQGNIPQVSKGSQVMGSLVSNDAGIDGAIRYWIIGCQFGHDVHAMPTKIMCFR